MTMILYSDSNKTIDSLTKEIKLTEQMVQNEKSKWFAWRRKDVTRQEALIVKLATQLVEMLGEVYHNISRSINDHPRTAEEELQLAMVAKALQDAYSSSNQKDQATNMGAEVQEAKIRAKAIQSQAEKEAAMSKKAEELTVWAKNPMNSYMRMFRSLPVANWFMWTKESANLEAAKIRVQLAEELLEKSQGYPKLQKSCIEDLIVKKQVLLKLLEPGTREELAISRELREHAILVNNLKYLEAVKEKIEVIQTKLGSSSNNHERIELLLGLQEQQTALQNIYTINTPEHTAIKKEIQRVQSEIQRLTESLAPIVRR